MQINSIILHHIWREDNDAPQLNLSEDLLDKEDNNVEEFVIKLIKSFSSKRPTYGSFQPDEITYPFQTFVNEYIEHDDFLSFSKQAMHLLERDIQVSQAKGGYVVFLHYTEQINDFLITCMLDKSEQFTIDDESLDITKLKILDLEKIARANRLNIRKWKDSAETYLSFIKGTRGISHYFQKFIGNTDLTSSKVNSKNLKEAINKYMRDNDFNSDQKENVLENVKEYMTRQFNNEQDVKITAVAAHINPDSPSSFITFIQEDIDIEVSGSFRLDKKGDFGNFFKAKIKGAGYSIEFDRNLINNSKVRRDGNDLIFSDLPEEELNRIFSI